MGYVLKAVLSSAQHPEYGQITVPFPIPDEKYDRMIELLEPLEIGDALRQDFPRPYSPGIRLSRALYRPTSGRLLPEIHLYGIPPGTSSIP